MRAIFVSVVALLMSACSQSNTRPVSVSDCAQMSGVPDGNLLLFGEMHGSVESPALIARLACSLSTSQALAVGLEIPSSEQPRLDAYLTGDGSADAVRALTGSDFWGTNEDGRSSVAMLDLIERMRLLGRSGRSVQLFAFDDQPGTTLQRDVAIANGIRRYMASNPERRIIALMGNLHAMVEPIQFGGKELVPSGRLLSDLQPRSVFIAYPAGTIWACMPTCGLQELKAVKGAPGTPAIVEGSPMKGYTHTVWLPSITASPPVLRAEAGG